MKNKISRIFILIGTRPNFIKVTQFRRIAKDLELDIKIIHTGQHFDEKMADVFFKEFDLIPDYFLNISPGQPTVQIAEIISKLQNLIDSIGKPDLMIVPGDVNSTLAGAIFANKAEIKLAHLEAGLRSFDLTMPEEHNRVLTDAISDINFVTEQSGIDNLRANHSKGQTFFVGNTMIDTLVAFEPKIDSSDILKKMGVQRDYIVTTIHRPGNVDTKVGLEKLFSLFVTVAEKYDILFPVHPRTLNRMKSFGLYESFNKISGLKFIEPLGYFDFQKMIKHAKLVLTDSGGIQEETTFRKIPCLTLRPNTERPVTCTIGTNTLVPFDADLIMNFIRQIEEGNYKKGGIPPLWDGRSTERILDIIKELKH